MRSTTGLLCLTLASALTLAAPPAAPAPDMQAMIDALLPRAQRVSRNLPAVANADAVAAAVGMAGGGAASAPDTAAQPVAAGTELPAASPPSLSLAIRFTPNSAQVKPESGPVLGSLVAAMQSPELRSARFVIEGHGDAGGGAAASQRLSQERADEVRLYLVALGVNPARLRAVGRGGSPPAEAKDRGTAAGSTGVRVVTVE